MIDATALAKATRLKKAMDAAYTVFRKEPTAETCRKWTNASLAFSNFSTDTIKGLIEEDPEVSKAEILSNVDEYRTCKQCGKTLLYTTEKDNFVTTGSFLKDFQGWCFDCLVEHCMAQDCESCVVSKNSSSCSFSEIKNLYKNK